MVTTRITVKQHLREYVIGKYNDHVDGPICFPDNLDVYHTIWDLTEKRPVNCPIDSGNLEIALPDRRVGKSPETYNYLGQRSQGLIQRKIENLFFAELHDLLDSEKHRNGVPYIETTWHFIKKYNIVSLTEDAILKNYYRWREDVRRREKRSYNRKINNRQSA